MMQITVNRKPNAARISINSRLFWGTIRTLENVLEEPNTIFLKSDKNETNWRRRPPEDQEDARIGQPSTQPWKRVCKGPQEPHTGTAAATPGLGPTLHILTMKNT